MPFESEMVVLSSEKIEELRSKARQMLSSEGGRKEMLQEFREGLLLNTLIDLSEGCSPDASASHARLARKQAMDEIDLLLSMEEEMPKGKKG